MAAISAERLELALDKAGMTKKQFREALAEEGFDLSLQYVCDVVGGRAGRTLKRSPDLRKAMAKVIGVPQDWIEVPRPTHAEVA